MKIGILTYHRADNFGAVLQAYALSTYLHQEGCDTEIIDYRCMKIEAQYHIFSPLILLTRKNVFISAREYFNRFKNMKDRMRRRRKFAEFRDKYLPLSESIHHIKRPLAFDVIITGSDQVWNFHMNKGSESIYLLDFPMCPQTKRVAYAASSEQNGMIRIGDEYLRLCLENFDKISVRETFIKEKLQKLVAENIEICLDPIFLLAKEHYEKIAVKPVLSKYILVYHMTYAPEVLPLAHKVAKEIDAEVVELFANFKTHDDAHHVTVWSPTDLIGYIANADKIFTTSFHGLALSLILNKDVWVINKGDNLRQRNLLRQAGLPNRLLQCANDYSNENIDYNRVKEKLQPLISKSKEFLSIMRK